MKTLTFNKNSWHFLLASKVANYTAPYEYTYDDGEVKVLGDSGDICTYSKHVMGGLLILTISAALIACVGLVLAHVVLGIWFSVMLGTFFFTELGIAGLSVAILAGLFFSAKTYLDRRADRLLSTEYRNRVVKPDGFVKCAYRSWKEKFCLSINFVDTSK